MEKQNEHFHHILLFYYKKGKNAAQAHKKLCAVYGKDVLTERQCQRWFANFRSGNASMKDAPRLGRPIKDDDDKIKELLEDNPYYSTREIAEKLNVSHTSIEEHLKQLGYIKKLDILIPHELEEAHLVERIHISDYNLKRLQRDPFLKRVITGGLKWIVYDSIERKRSRNKSLQTDIHQREILLSVWWDYKGIVFFELLECNETIDLYCDQLDKVHEAIKHKRPQLRDRKSVVFLSAAAKANTMLVPGKKILLQLGWEKLQHPPYSPDLSPSDYHLFRCLQDSLKGEKFDSNEAIKRYLEQFFVNKDRKFYEAGIMELSNRWQKVVESSGQYITE